MPKRIPAARHPLAGKVKLGINGARVRQARERLGMTQTQLAYHTGGQASNISAIENGLMDVQSVKLAALALVLAVSADWLMTLTDDPTPHGRK